MGLLTSHAEIFYPGGFAFLGTPGNRRARSTLTNPADRSIFNTMKSNKNVWQLIWISLAITYAFCGWLIYPH